MSDFILQVEKLSASAREKALIDRIEQLEWGYEAACNTLEARDKEIGQLEARVKELETQLHNLLMSRGGTWIFMPNSERPQPPEEET